MRHPPLLPIFPLPLSVWFVIAFSAPPPGTAGQAAAQVRPDISRSEGASCAWPRQVPPSRLQGEVRPGLTRTDRVVVKFREGTRVRLRSAGLTDLNGSDLRSLRAWVLAHPGIRVSRHFARSEEELDRWRAEGERRSGARLADLNLYYRFLLPAGTDVARANAILEELRSLPEVESAFPEPIPLPAVIDPLPPTPDFSGLQGYLGASPSGINARTVWPWPGGRGAGVRLCDIEGAWLWTHEDLPAPFFQSGTMIEESLWRDHGTAVLCEMAAADNGFGVTGISSDMQVGSISQIDLAVAGSIDLAAATLEPGDLFLIELHSYGPRSYGGGQYGFLPMEFWQDTFDAIRQAVANGRICIEAAGNGQQDLDDPYYQGVFDRALRNSGAILVGAGTPTGLQAEWFTNYGSRVDLNGWGSSVTTCAYGDLQGGAETQRYTSSFSGTSSASPIVAGAVACLQGMSKASLGLPLNASLAVQILSETGTPWVGPLRIGNRPDLAAARDLLLQGFGTVTGEVRDSRTGQPIVNADLEALSTTAFARTDSAGRYVLPLLAGIYTIRTSDFFHGPQESPVTVGTGPVGLDITLDPLPSGDLAGTVLSRTGQPVAGAAIRILDTPIPDGRSGPGGDYRIGGIPAAPACSLVCGLSPGRGSAFRTAPVSAGLTTLVTSILVDAETFEAGNGSFAGGTPWAWGIPFAGPPEAFSGTRVWGTNLAGNYPFNSNAYLTSPVHDFSGAGTLFLSFTHWYLTEADADGGNVQVHVGGNWITVTPIGGYPGSFWASHYEPGYTGSSGGWQPAVFDLTPYISSAVQIRFHFVSDGSANAAGWYIDDVAFDTGSIPAGVDPPLWSRPGAILLPARPNPFHDSAVIEFRLLRAGRVDLRIFDPAGRLVRTLAQGPIPAGEHRDIWDGRDAAGRPALPGAYYCRLDLDGARIGASKLERIR